MALVSVTEAARLTGKNRATIHRYIKQGKVSQVTDETGTKKVDTSELLRVFGTLSATPATLPHSDAIQHDATQDMVEITTKTKRVTNKRGDMMLVNNDTGEIQTQIAGFWEAHEVDCTKFVKLFIKGVKALKELTGAGTKVFEMLYMRIQESIGKDQIYMSFNIVDQTLTPMSEATYARGIRELIEKEFLAASPNIGLYWLNLSFVWNELC
jgi:hypothetical protein